MQLSHYNESIVKIYKLQILQNVSNCELVKISMRRDKYEVLIIKRISKQKQIKLVIYWDCITQNPTLRFQIWDTDQNKLIYNLECVEKMLPRWFVVTMSIVSNCSWYVVGNCDTEQIINADHDDDDTGFQILNRWIQIYILNWLN